MMPCSIAAPVTSASKPEPIINPILVPLSGLCSLIKEPLAPQEQRARTDRLASREQQAQPERQVLKVQSVPQAPPDRLDWYGKARGITPRLMRRMMPCSIAAPVT